MEDTFQTLLWNIDEHSPFSCVINPYMLWQYTKPSYCINVLQKCTFSLLKIIYLRYFFKYYFLTAILKIGSLKAFWIVSDLLPITSTRAGQIPYELSHFHFQNLHCCCHSIFHHTPVLRKSGSTNTANGISGQWFIDRIDVGRPGYQSLKSSLYSLQLI